LGSAQIYPFSLEIRTGKNTYVPKAGKLRKNQTNLNSLMDEVLLLV
jgi:hypothetical protein